MDPSTPRRPSLPRNVKVLGLASLLNDIASEMIFPLLPSFLLEVLRGNVFVLGAIEGLADSVASLLKLWSGGRSDQAGRRKGFVVFGYSLAAVTRPLIGAIAAPWQLFLIRIGDRIGKGVRTAPRDALIADSTSPAIRGRAFGFHRAMDHVGAAIGPLLATAFLWLWPGELRLMFLLTLLPGLLVVGLLVLGLRETPATSLPLTPDPSPLGGEGRITLPSPLTPNPSPPRGEGRIGLPSPLGGEGGIRLPSPLGGEGLGVRGEPLRWTLAPFDRPFRLYLLALVVFTLGNSSDAFLLVRARDLEVREALLPLLWFAFHVVKSTSNLLVGRAVDRLGPRPFLYLGWFLYAAVYLAFGLATAAWQAWALFLSYGLFYGLTEPAEKTLVAALVGGERKGLAYGWYNCAIGIATLPASLIFGALYQVFGALAAFAWGAALSLVAVVLLAALKGIGGDSSRVDS